MLKETSEYKTHIVSATEPTEQPERSGQPEQSQLSEPSERSGQAGQLGPAEPQPIESDGELRSAVAEPGSDNSADDSTDGPGLSSCNISSVVSAADPAPTAGIGGSVEANRSWPEFLKKQFAWAMFMTVAVFSGMICYLSLEVLTGSIYWGYSGVQADAFNNSVANCSFVGILLAIFLQICFFSSLAGRERSKTSLVIQIFVVGMVLLCSFVTGLTYGIEAVLGLGLCLAVSALGRAVRTSLPPTFRLSRALKALALAMIPAALMLPLVVLLGSANPDPPGAEFHFHDYTSGGAEVGTFLFGLFLALPSFVMARCARTGEFQPLLVLNMLTSSPFLITMLVTSTFMVFESGAPLMIPAVLTIIAYVGAVIAASTWLGAACNNHFHQASVRRTQ